MPRVGFTPDNKQGSPYDYPKLSLERGERARIVVMDTDPWFEYVHTLRMPSLDPNGKVKTIKVQKYGKEVDEIDYEFVGRHICIGDPSTITEKGADAKTCPVCRASTETDAVKAPERRFAAHIIQYATKPGSFEVANPFQVSLKAWAFGNKVFDTITDYREESGDLKVHDLLLGPCESAQFQKFSIQITTKQAEWLGNEERKALTATTFKENQCKDLSALIARKLGRDLIEEDLEKVLYRNRVAFGKETPVEEVPTVEDVQSALDIGDLFDSNTGPDDSGSPSITEFEVGDLESLLEDL